MTRLKGQKKELPNESLDDPDSDATSRSEVPQMFPLSMNPEPGNEDIDTDRCCMFCIMAR